MAEPEKQPESVSIFRLLANPESFSGKFIRVEGFLHIKHEDQALYANIESADHLMTQNAFWIKIDQENIRFQPLQKNLKFISLHHFNEKFVLIEAVFDYQSKGHMGMFSGTLDKVSRIMEKKKYHDGSGKNQATGKGK
jgi:hypothetical protein